MSDLSNTPKLQNEIYGDREAPSPWTMLITMLLLIAGLLLASALMMNHLSKTNSESGATSATRRNSLTANWLLPATRACSA